MLDRLFDAILCWAGYHAERVADVDWSRGVWIYGCRRRGCVWEREEGVS